MSQIDAYEYEELKEKAHKYDQIMSADSSVALSNLKSIETRLRLRQAGYYHGASAWYINNIKNHILQAGIEHHELVGLRANYIIANLAVEKLQKELAELKEKVIYYISINNSDNVMYAMKLLRLENELKQLCKGSE